MASIGSDQKVTAEGKRSNIAPFFVLSMPQYQAFEDTKRADVQAKRDLCTLVAIMSELSEVNDSIRLTKHLPSGAANSIVFSEISANLNVAWARVRTLLSRLPYEAGTVAQAYPLLYDLILLTNLFDIDFSSEAALVDAENKLAWIMQFFTSVILAQEENVAYFGELFKSFTKAIARNTAYEKQIILCTEMYVVLRLLEHGRDEKNNISLLLKAFDSVTHKSKVVLAWLSRIKRLVNASVICLSDISSSAITALQPIPGFLLELKNKVELPDCYFTLPAQQAKKLAQAEEKNPLSVVIKDCEQAAFKQFFATLSADLAFIAITECRLEDKAALWQMAIAFGESLLSLKHKALIAVDEALQTHFIGTWQIIRNKMVHFTESAVGYQRYQILWLDNAFFQNLDNLLKISLAYVDDLIRGVQKPLSFADLAENVRFSVVGSGLPTEEKEAGDIDATPSAMSISQFERWIMRFQATQVALSQLAPVADSVIKERATIFYLSQAGELWREIMSLPNLEDFLTSETFEVMRNLKLLRDRVSHHVQHVSVYPITYFTEQVPYLIACQVATEMQGYLDLCREQLLLLDLIHHVGPIWEAACALKKAPAQFVDSFNPHNDGEQPVLVQQFSAMMHKLRTPERRYLRHKTDPRHHHSPPRPESAEQLSLCVADPFKLYRADLRAESVGVVERLKAVLSRVEISLAQPVLAQAKPSLSPILRRWLRWLTLSAEHLSPVTMQGLARAEFETTPAVHDSFRSAVSLSCSTPERHPMESHSPSAKAGYASPSRTSKENSSRQLKFSPLKLSSEQATPVSPHRGSSAFFADEADDHHPRRSAKKPEGNGSRRVLTFM